MLLTRLLSVEEANIWRAGFESFRLMDELTPDPTTVSLLIAITDRFGTAPRLNATFLVICLGTPLPHQTGLVGRIAEGLIRASRTELGHIQTVAAATSKQLVDLAVTLHRLGPETREIGTSLFE